MKITDENYKFWNKRRRKDLHELISGPVDWTESKKHAKTHRTWIETKLIREYLDSRTRPAVAEIGCGLGRLMKEFMKHYHVAGFDISPNMLSGAKEYLKTDLLKLIGLFQVKYDDSKVIRPLDEFPEKFNFIFSFLTFQHLQTQKEVEAYIRHMEYMLKPGGFIRVQTYKGAPHTEERFGGFHGHFFPSLDTLVEAFHKNKKLAVMEKQEGLGHKDWLWVTVQKGSRALPCDK